MVWSGSVRIAAAVAQWLAVALVLAGAVALAGGDWWRGPVAVAVAAAVTALLLLRTVRRFGGVTGDVFGAAVEAVFAVLVVVLV